jgi:hypothetical protein
MRITNACSHEGIIYLEDVRGSCNEVVLCMRRREKIDNEVLEF